MSEFSTNFTVNLETQGEGELDSTAASLEALAGHIKNSSSEIGAMRAAMKNMKGGGDEAAASIQILKDKIDIHKQAIAESQSKYVQLGGSFTKAGNAARESAAATAAATASQVVSANAAAQSVAAASQVSKQAAAEQARVARAAAVEQKRLADETSKAQAALLAEQSAAAVAGASLGELKVNLIRDTQEVTKLGTALRALGPSNAQNAKLVDSFTAKLAKQKAMVAAASARYAGLGGDLSGIRNSVSALNQPSRTLVQRMADLGEGAALLPGPLGQTVGQMGGLRALMAGGMLGATVVLAAAVVALAAAFVYLTGKLLFYGTGLAAARREQELTLKGLVAATKTIRGQSDTGEGLAESIRRVADETSSTSTEIQGFATTLFEAGLRGNKLETAMKAVGVANLAAGSKAASSYIKQAVAANQAGASLDKLAAKAQHTFGDIASARALTFGRQMILLKERLGKIFDGLKLDGFLKAMTAITHMFRENGEVGKSLALIFETMFQPLVDGATTSIPFVRRAIYKVLIGVFDLATAFFKVRNAVRDALEGSTIGRWIKAESTMLLWRGAVLAVKAAVIALGVAIAVSLLPVMVGIAAGVATWALIAGAIELVIKAVNWLGVTWAEFTAAINPDGLVSTFDVMMTSAWDSLMSIDFVKAGVDMVNGLIKGITSIGSKVGEAFKSVANSAFGSFNQEAEIKSPSRRSFRAGGHIGEGLSLGVERHAPRVRASARHVANAATDIKPRRVEIPAPRIRAAGTGARASASVGAPQRLRERFSAARSAPRPLPERTPRFASAPRTSPAPFRPPHGPRFAASPVRPPPVRPTVAPPVPAPVAVQKVDTSSQVNTNRHSSQINVGGVTIKVEAKEGQGGKQMAEEVWAEFVRKLEGSAISVGARV